MIREASLAEVTIEYANRFRDYYRINDKLDLAMDYFFQGNYRDSLNEVLSSIKKVDNDVYKELVTICGNNSF